MLANGNSAKQPTLESIVFLLEALLRKEKSRQDVANWAISYMVEDEYKMLTKKNDYIKQMLEKLSALEIKDSTAKYIYKENNINEWVQEIRGIIKNNENHLLLDGKPIKQPSLDFMINLLKAILDGKKSREEVANWAAFYITHDDPELYPEYRIDETDVWEMLGTLAGIDLQNSPAEYLHNEEDIKGWIQEAKSKISKH